ncbi:hypothetical protein [Aquimarina longa]|uniref:hypothetical protein n=1 Tax=Aquimarina longa TaxID=1080221 RepID=UPI0007838394|nr:hypothetical protein [Aquimarina longa]
MNITKKHITKALEKLNEIEKLDEYLKNSKFSQTLTACYNFIDKIGGLQKDFENIKSAYTAKCLLRTIIEQYLVNYYIFYKFILNKNDEIGEHYYKAYFVSECLKKDMYQLGIDGMLNGIKNNATFTNLKEKLSPSFDEMSQTDYDGFHKLGKQFDIKKIQNFLLTNPLQEGFFEEINKKDIPEFLSMYNVLSSYIHGGPNAEMEYKKNRTDITDSLEWSRILYFQTITNFFALLISVDRKFEYLKEYTDLNKYT